MTAIDTGTAWFTVYGKKLGGHYHCRVYAGPFSHQRRGGLGKLTMDEKDWAQLQELARSNPLLLAVAEEDR